MAGMSVRAVVLKCVCFAVVFDLVFTLDTVFPVVSVGATWRVFGAAKTTHLVCSKPTDHYSHVSSLGGTIVTEVILCWGLVSSHTHSVHLS